MSPANGMGGFDSGKIASAVVGLLLVFGAVVSGGIYPWSVDVFVFAVVLVFLLTLATLNTKTLKSLWPVWALLGITYLSALWTVCLNDTLAQAFKLTGYALFAFASASASKAGRRDALLKTAFAAATLVAVYGIYQYYIGFAHTEAYLREAGATSGLSAAETARAMATLKYRRAFSTLLSPNVLACYLAVAFPLGLGLFGQEVRKGRKALYGLGLLSVLIAFMLAKSVGGFAALAAGVTVYLALKYGQRPWKPGVRAVLTALAAVAVLSAVGYALVEQRSSGPLGFEKSASERVNYWKISVKVASESPFVGHGAGTFGILYPAHASTGATESKYAHNVFLQTLAETGTLGLVAIMLVFAGFLYYCFRHMRRESGGSPLAPAVLAGGVGFLAHNLADFTFYVPETAILFWFYFGLAASWGEDKPPDEGRRPGPLAKALLLVLTLVFGFFYVKAYLAYQKKADALAVLRLNGITSSSIARKTPAPEEALRLAEDAVALKPYDDTSHAFLAGLYEGREAVDGPVAVRKAEEEYKAAIGLNPYYAYYYKELGILYLKFGEKAKAREEFSRALERYPANKLFLKYLQSAEN